MSVLKTIVDRGAVVAWSPLTGPHAHVLATGSKEGGGGGFDDRGGDLTLYAADLSSATQECRVVGRCAQSREGRAARGRGCARGGLPPRRRPRRALITPRVLLTRSLPRPSTASRR